jgi:alpha-tubulin suppressor-like RCC1 family protein
MTTGYSVRCWGDNSYGKLGDGTLIDRYVSVPVCEDSACLNDIDGIDAITTSAAYGSHTCALTTSGGVKCWGLNHIGQLGVSSSTTTDCAPSLACSTTPVDVTSLSSGVTAVDAGARFTCAITDSEDAKCWGSDVNGELGNGSAGGGYTPGDVDLPSGTNVASISGGYLHACALTTDGDVWCWGSNDFGQLGTGAGTGDQHTPIELTALEDVAAISAGWYHTCALLDTGGMKCWGQSESGQLGDGALCGVTPGVCDGVLTTADEAFIERSPVDVCDIGATRPCGSNLIEGIAKIDAGFAHTCAITTVGRRPLCWGYNDDGQVGDGTTSDIATPVEVLWDTDRDGCTDDQELGTNPALGGLRDPRNFWDFYDTPNNDNVRDRAITIPSGDPARVTARFGADDDGGADPINRNSDPFAPAPAAPAYPPAFDRGSATQSTPNAADGAITLVNDILAVYAQLLHSCA